MKKYFLFVMVSSIFSTVSFAADSIACMPSDDTEAAVMMLQKMDGPTTSYAVTIAEDFAPQYIENQTVTLEENKDLDILSLKDKTNEIKISLDKGFLNKLESAKEKSSKGTVKMTIGQQSVIKDIICLIYE